MVEGAGVVPNVPFVASTPEEEDAAAPLGHHMICRDIGLRSLRADERTGRFHWEVELAQCG